MSVLKNVLRSVLMAAALSLCASVPAAPVLNFPFNEGTGETTTDTVSGVVGLLEGAEWTNDTPAGVTGDFALAFSLDFPEPKDDVLVDLSAAPLDLGANNTNYTLQGWIKMPTEPLEERRVILRTDGAATRVSLSINANRTLHTTLLGNTDFTSGVMVPNDHRWHHVAAVMEDFSRVHFYLDGVLRQTVNRTRENAATGGGSERLLIGKESESRFYRGILDRVRIDTNALSIAELDFPAVAGLPRFETVESQPVDVAVALGGTATFSATPTSSTPVTQQWYYRTNLADQVGVALAGQTGNTLMIENVEAADLGYYYLVVTNEVGRVESYAARLSLPVDLTLPPTGFEAPAYTSGPIDGQNGWTTDVNTGSARVLTVQEITTLLESAGFVAGETVHGGTQALVVSGLGVASNTIRPVTGHESATNVTLDVWIRPLAAGVASAEGNVFFTLENSANVRAAAFRLGAVTETGARRLDYGTTVTGVWQDTGIVWDENTWYRITFEVDYVTKTYDFLVNGTQVNTEPIPFYTATSDRFSQIRIFRGANQAGMIVDDLSVTSEGGAEEPPSLEIRRDGQNVVIAWLSSAEGYTLQATELLSPANWQTVTHTTNGAENIATVQPTGTSRFFRLVK